MTSALSHRGPDDHGIWQDPTGRVFLGHRRLAIIDLSSEGAQPMLSEDGRFAIVFNGEIYNYLELQKELNACNVSIKGRSDTAVLLAALGYWGLTQTLERAVGMFAFALWDRKEDGLYLARDRAGKKPLFFCHQEDRFYFASELKAFKQIHNLSLHVNYEIVPHYLSLGYIPAPDTIYREVYKLLPGHWMQVNSNLRTKTEPYWHLPTGQRYKIPFEEAVEEVDRRLSESVRIRLRADVPVGIFLSGGIDSGLITALAASHADQPVQTFTVGFDVGVMDEAPLARIVAERYETEHHEIRLNPDLDDLLPQVVRAYDEPIADTSILPTFAISRETSKELKVVLSGEGSDEIFGGYRRHLAVKYYQHLLAIARVLPQPVWKGLHRWLPLPSGFRTPYSFLHRFLRGFAGDSYERYLIWGSDSFTEDEKTRLFQQNSKAFVPTSQLLADRYSRFNCLDPLGHFMALDFVVGMSDCLLVKLDIATMAHSLEARCPFLDHRLIDWCASLDYGTLMPGRTNKPLLRSLALRYLPDELVRAPKRGFEIPLVQWMRGKLFERVHDLCLDSNGIILRIFEPEEIRMLLQKRTGIDEVRWANRLWTLLMLALWDREHGHGVAN